MKTGLSLAVAVIVALLPAAAMAELKQVASDGFLVEHHYTIERSTAESWAELVHPERWWPEDHTWSGSRGNLSLVPEAGGCFCERWARESVEHARVVMSREGHLLRLRGSLGPLQEMGLTGVLTIALTEVEAGTAMTVTYRVSGDSLHQLGDLAPVVDEVVGLQFGALADFTAPKH